jgi:hypothetical protein
VRAGVVRRTVRRVVRRCPKAGATVPIKSANKTMKLVARSASRLLFFLIIFYPPFGVPPARPLKASQLLGKAPATAKSNGRATVFAGGFTDEKAIYGEKQAPAGHGLRPCLPRFARTARILHESVWAGRVHPPDELRQPPSPPARRVGSAVEKLPFWCNLCGQRFRNYTIRGAG